MERPIVFPDEGCADTDVLRGWKAAMVGVGWLAEAALGTSTVVDGLACTPGTGLTVSIAAGQIYFQEQTDATAYGSFAVDTHLLVKQGLSLDPVVLACPAPSTAGQSINYLVEAQYQDLDTGSTLLPFYDPANPTVPYSGPGNDGLPSLTIRRGVCALQIKAGVAATTGSQTTPAADAGWTGIWVVTIAQGASGVVTGNIAQLATAPFIGTKLPAVTAAIQSGQYNFALDTGTANHIVAALSPVPASLQTGLEVQIKMAHTTTSTTVDLNLNGTGAEPVQWAGAGPTAGGLIAGLIYTFVYDASGPTWSMKTPPSLPSGFTSTGNAIANGVSVLHGLGVAPFNIRVTLVCGTANLGYSVGDEVDLPAATYAGGASGTNTYCDIGSNATNVWCNFTDHTNIGIGNKTGGSGGAITTADWTITFRARP